MTAVDKRLVLDGWHRDRGARFSSLGGVAVPESYGDWRAELESMGSAVALVDASYESRLELVGEDRLRFLNGLCTRNTSALSAGESVSGYITDSRGHILADLTVLALADRAFLVLPPARGEAIAEHLGRYVVTDRVEIRSLDDLVPLTLAGPGVRFELESRGAEVPAEAGGHLRSSLFGSQVHLEHHSRLGVPGFTVWASASIARPFADQLVDELGARPAGMTAIAALRIAAGLPRFGVDYDASNLPQEVAVEHAVDFKKGCYLGQEVIARLHYRGQVARQIRRLVIESGVAEPAAILSFEGRECGVLTSVQPSPVPGPRFALAMIQRRASEAGTEIEIAGGGRARVKPVA